MLLDDRWPIMTSHSIHAHLQLQRQETHTSRPDVPVSWLAVHSLSSLHHLELESTTSNTFLVSSPNRPFQSGAGSSWVAQAGREAWRTFCIWHLSRQPMAVSDISIYICLIDIRDGSSKPVYGGVDRLQALSSAKTGRRSCFFMN